MIDKRFLSGAVAVVTLIVAGASALPELLLRPASTGPTVAVPLSAPTAEPIVQRGSVPAANRADPIAPPMRSTVEAALEPVATGLDAPKAEPEETAAPASAPRVAFPPVQPVGVAAVSVVDVVPPANPQTKPANPTPPIADKPAQSERTAQRSAKSRQNVRPAAYPMAEFLAWRR